MLSQSQRVILGSRYSISTESNDGAFKTYIFVEILWKTAKDNTLIGFSSFHKQGNLQNVSCNELKVRDIKIKVLESLNATPEVESRGKEINIQSSY